MVQDDAPAYAAVDVSTCEPCAQIAWNMTGSCIALHQDDSCSSSLSSSDRCSSFERLHQAARRRFVLLNDDGVGDLSENVEVAG